MIFQRIWLHLCQLMLILSLARSCTDVTNVTNQAELEDALLCAKGGTTSEIIINSEISVQSKMIIEDTYNLVIRSGQGFNLRWTAGGQGYRIFDIKKSKIQFSGLNFLANIKSGALNIVASDVSFVEVQISPVSTGVSAIHGGGIMATNHSTITLNQSSIYDWIGEEGSGAHIQNSVLRAYKSNFVRNIVSSRGGAIFAGNMSTIEISTSCNFTMNSGQYGGALFSEAESVVRISDSIFNLNAADYGSALYRDTSSNLLVGDALLTITSSLFRTNHASSIGAIYTDVSTTLLDVTCIGNIADIAGGCVGIGDGGEVTATRLQASQTTGSAILCSSGLFTCSFCDFYDNIGEYGGAILSGGNGRFILTDSNFNNNSVTNEGGAIYTSPISFDPSVASKDIADRALGNITRCMLTGNSAGSSGGAIYAESSNLLLEASQLRDNFVSGRKNTAGGAVYAYDSMLTADSVSVSGSSAVNGGGFFCTQGTVLSMQHSNISDSVALNSGGAIRVEYSSVAQLKHVIFSSCRSSSMGGALHVAYTSLANIEDCQFEDLFASNGGGAIYVLNDSPLNITGSTFRNVTALNTGGCIYADGVVVTAYSNLFSSCTSNSGGAMHLFFSNLYSAENIFSENLGSEGGALAILSYSFINSVGDSFFNNTADFTGGAVTISSSTAAFTDSTFYASGGEYGGVIYATSGASLEVSSCVFSSNRADYDGGALYVQSLGAMTIRHTVFQHNFASSGGAFFSTDTVTTMLNITFEHNAAIEAGGAIVMQSKSSVVVVDSVFSNNLGFLGGAIGVDASKLKTENCLFQGNGAKSKDIVNGLNTLGINISFSEDGYGGVINAFLGAIFTHNCTFVNNTAYAGGVVSLQLSMLASTSSTYTGNYGDDGGCVYLLDFNRWLSQGDVFSRNIAGARGSIVYGVEYGIVIVDQSKFFGASGVDIGIKSVQLSDGTFVCSNSSFDGGGNGEVVSSSQDSTLNLGRLDLANVAVTITNCVFSYFHGDTGGAAVIKANSKVIITDTTFSNCRAIQAGGALVFSGVIDITVWNCSFIANSALAGGAIFLSNAEISVSYSLFFNNRAIEGGGAIFWDNSILNELEIIYSQNDASFGENTASTPFRIDVNNTEDFAVMQSSGKILTSPVEIVVKDYYNQTILIKQTVVQTEIITVAPLDTDASISGATLRYANFTSGVTPFSDLAVTLRPGTNVTLEFSVQQDSIENARLFISFRECQAGEIVNQLADSQQEVCEVCAVGTYSFDPTETDCRECPDNANCPGGNVIDVDNGYWRQCQECHDVLQCVYKHSCLGGTDTAEQCRKGTEGPTCSVCSDDYFRNGNGGCNVCEDSTSIIDIVIAVLIVVLIASLFYCWRKKEWIKEKIEDLANKVDETIEKYELKVYLTKMKILVAFLQILVNIPQVLAVVFPKSFEKFIRAFGLVNLSFLDVFATECVFETNFYTSLLVSTIGPPLLVSLADICLRFRYIIAVRENKLRPRYTHKQKNIDRKIFFCIVAFFVFSPVSITIFQTFVCEKYEDGKRYLVADASVDCDTETHKSYVIYAAFMILLYPIGIPAYYAYHLTHNYYLINPPTSLVVREEEVDIVSAAVIQEEKIKLRQNYEKIQGISFLYDSYLPECWYFEVIECFRRLALTALPVIFLRSTVLQIVLVLILSLAFSALYMELRPFVNKSDNRVAIISQWSVSLTVLGALCLKVDMSDEDVTTSSGIGVLLAVMNATIIALTVYLTINNDDPVIDTIEKVKGGKDMDGKPSDIRIEDVHYDSDDDSSAISDAEQGKLSMAARANQRRGSAGTSGANVQSLKEFERRVSIRKQILEEREAERAEQQALEGPEESCPGGATRRYSAKVTRSGSDPDTPTASGDNARRLSVRAARSGSNQDDAAAPAETVRRLSTRAVNGLTTSDGNESTRNPIQERKSEVEEMVLFSRAPFSNARQASAPPPPPTEQTAPAIATSASNKRKSSFFGLLFDSPEDPVEDGPERDSRVEMNVTTPKTQQQQLGKDSDDEDSDDDSIIN